MAGPCLGKAGFYKLTGVAAGLVLTAAGANEQLWKIDQFNDGSFRLPAKTGGQALTATIHIKPGNGVAFQKFGRDDAQHWSITAP